ncbi:hypothetical protein ACH5RR_040536 [Cinchona calisaya]|uniref:Uncharacterized protein n=1 Tax=Cinchona calisaya TaxID=153742 RepID=A0ABD2XS09_9GENT
MMEKRAATAPATHTTILIKNNVVESSRVVCATQTNMGLRAIVRVVATMDAVVLETIALDGLPFKDTLPSSKNTADLELTIEVVHAREKSNCTITTTQVLDSCAQLRGCS